LLDRNRLVTHTVRAMKQREYDTLKNQIESEYRTKIDALELIWKMSNKGAPSSNQTGRGAVLQAVKAVVSITHGNFNTSDVEKHIKESNPALGAKIKRASISNTLKRLVKDKMIEVVEQGTGRQASTYKKVPIVRVG
jgi:fatty acid/phospholipid biosynthesis enzyme